MQRPAEDQDAVSYERMSVISGEKMEGNGLQIKIKIADSVQTLHPEKKNQSCQILFNKTN